MDIATNQQANQLYACEGIGGAGLPRKASQGGGAAHPDAIYGDQSCVALEQESWADGINQRKLSSSLAAINRLNGDHVCSGVAGRPDIWREGKSQVLLAVRLQLQHCVVSSRKPDFHSNVMLALA